MWPTLIAAYIWRAVNVKAAGRKLVRDLSAASENKRFIAGMGLVQAGARSLPLLDEAKLAGHWGTLHQRVREDIEP